MQTRILSLAREPKAALDAALQIVRSGGIILFPTESVYGLGVDSAQSAAIDRLYELKGRPREKPFQWMAPDIESARSASMGWDERAEKLARAFWPGPLTLVVPTHHGRAIGWRVPRHDRLLEFLRQLKRPLVATSANLAGKPARKTFKTAFQPFLNAIELALDGGVIESGMASTVVALKPSCIQILRRGVISEKAIRKAIADE